MHVNQKSHHYIYNISYSLGVICADLYISTTICCLPVAVPAAAAAPCPEAPEAFHGTLASHQAAVPGCFPPTSRDHERVKKVNAQKPCGKVSRVSPGK